MNKVTESNGQIAKVNFSSKLSVSTFLMEQGYKAIDKMTFEQMKVKARKRLNLIEAKELRTSKRIEKTEIAKEFKELVKTDKAEFLNEYFSLNSIFSAIKRQSKTFKGQMVEGLTINEVAKLDVVNNVSNKEIQQYHVLGLVDNINNLITLVTNGNKFAPSKVHSLIERAIKLDAKQKQLLFDKGARFANRLNALKIGTASEIEIIESFYKMECVKTTRIVDKKTVTLLNVSSCKKIQLLTESPTFISNEILKDVIELALLTSENNTVKKANEINASRIGASSESANIKAKDIANKKMGAINKDASIFENKLISA